MTSQANINSPANVPSYPGLQNPPQYSAPHYPAPPAMSVQHTISQYPVSNPALFNQSGFAAPNVPFGSLGPPPNTAVVTGQMQLPHQDHQFMGAVPNQQQQQFPQGYAQTPQNEVPTPTAPSIDHMEKVPGYENITFDGGFLPPPIPDANARGQEPIRTNFSNFQTLTTEDAREALLEYVGEHCCYGKQAARNMTLNNIKNTSAVHYTLETFAEKRETLWAFEPYVGQIIDSPTNGPAPGPWEISIAMAEPYEEKLMLAEVPHTASVKQCHDCGALGRKTCYKCLGCGRVPCSYCRGGGHRYTTGRDCHRCSWCWGTGQVSCDYCNGNGVIVCPSCDGKLQLKWFIQLKSIWKVHLVDYIIERTPMPDDLVRTVTGQDIFNEDSPRVWPITNFPDEELNKASANCIQQHNVIQETERVVSQRHKIRLVPVAQVSSTWKGKNDDFYVYGFENKVHSPNYPQQCCWGCNIL